MPTLANGQLLDFPGHRHRSRDLDVVHGKLRAPVPRAGSVRRTALVNRLRAARRTPLVSIVAPAGYGKTTVLAQWATRDERPCVWVSVDRHDDDPACLIAHLAAALDRVAPVDDSLLDAVRFRGHQIWTSVVPRLTDVFASLPEPVIVVLDHLDRATSEETLEVVAMLVHQLPAESTLALAARVAPGIPLATLRADGLLLEVGPELLRLNRREAAALLAEQGVALADSELDELVERTEGWPAGLYLASLARRAGPGGRFSGADRTVVDYLRGEYLDGLAPERLAFLRRTSILESMSAPQCDELLGRTDSAGELEAIERASLFLVPLDRERGRFRYHHLFADLLRHDLELHHAGETRALHGRAARWYEAHGDRAAAVPHLFAAGEIDRAADAVAALVLEACDDGRRNDAERWIGRFGDAELERRPDVAALGAWVHLLGGHGTEPARLLALADRSGPHPLSALVRSALGRAGPEQMLADARAAVAALPEGSRAAALARFLEGAAHVLLDDLEAADAALRRASADALVSRAASALAGATAQRALIAARRGETGAADALAAEAVAVDLKEDARIGGGVLELALAARALLRRGAWEDAGGTLAAAEARSAKASAPAWLAVEASLELARARLTLRDRDGANRALAAARAALVRLPEPLTLTAEVHELSERAPFEPESHPAGLTPAELRLLPLLATHLSFREIGLRFHVSRNTIKTQAISAYRKLGVSSRSEAIERAAELGLLAGEVVRS